MHNFRPSPVITGDDAVRFLEEISKPPTEEQKEKYRKIAEGINQIRKNQWKNAKNAVISILSSYNGENADEVAEMVVSWFDKNRLNFI